MEFISHITFAHKWFLYILFIIPLIAVWYFYKKRTIAPLCSFLVIPH